MFRVVAPPSPANSDVGGLDNVNYSLDSSESDSQDDATPGPAFAPAVGSRGRGKGRRGIFGALVGKTAAADVAFPTFVHVGFAVEGRRAHGRGRHALGAGSVARGSRAEPWGNAGWTIARITVGWAGCRRHRNVEDLPGTATHCKTILTFGVLRFLGDAEVRRRAKVWLLCSVDVP